MNLKYSLFSPLFLLPVLMHAGDHSAGKASYSGGSASDKSPYHLFNPVPVESMRDMSTDRPDATESPITVDAGHFQIEASFFDYGRDRSGGDSADVWTYGAFNLKAGLLEHVDLQFVFDSYVDERINENGVRTTASGFSDLQMRMKINLWGNEGGPTALGLMPFVKIPTGTESSNDRWEGGVIVPFAMDLADGIGLGLMAEADFVHDDVSGGYETEWVHSAVVGIDLTERLGTFVEYMGVAGSDDGFRYQASFNTGLTYAVTENMQLDTGVRIGLNDAAEDFGVFTGISVRY